MQPRLIMAFLKPANFLINLVSLFYEQKYKTKSVLFSVNYLSTKPYNFLLPTYIKQVAKIKLTIFKLLYYLIPRAVSACTRHVFFFSFKINSFQTFFLIICILEFSSKTTSLPFEFSHAVVTHHAELQKSVFVTLFNVYDTADVEFTFVECFYTQLNLYSPSNRSCLNVFIRYEYTYHLYYVCQDMVLSMVYYLNYLNTRNFYHRIISIK